MNKNQAPSSIRVDLGTRGYDILCAGGLLANLGDILRQYFAKLHQPIMIVTDENVANLYRKSVARTLDGADIAQSWFVIPADENSKSFAMLERLSEDMVGAGLTRNTLIIALGGGVVGDLAGFFAAIAMRGVDFVQIPTTLLSQIDSAVGGKTAINIKQGKNLIGAFHQPRLVIADTRCLDDLPMRELRAGYAEMVKYGLLADREFFVWLDENAPALIGGDDELRRQAILRCCQIKADVVGQDEHEAGVRELLNLGHSFGHGIEAIVGYAHIRHGEAVAIGMHMACDISTRLGVCDDDIMPIINQHWQKMQLPHSIATFTNQKIDPQHFYEIMTHDKKNRDGNIRLILLKAIGNAFGTNEVSKAQLHEFLKQSAHINGSIDG